MKRLSIGLAIVCILSLCIVSCSSDKNPYEKEYGILTIDNIENLVEGSEAQISSVFSMPEKAETITYSFEGDYIMIEDGKVLALVGGKTVVVTATTEHHSATFTVTTDVARGDLNIDPVYAWVDYPLSKIIPVFSLPEYAEHLEFEYDTSALSIDPKTYEITAFKDGVYNVNATSEHFNESFKVIIEKINKNSSKYSASSFENQAANRLQQWKNRGTDEKTTIFIGDSFFDTSFWSDFYIESYFAKDALCLGISSTTTYDWEEWITDGWLSQTSPKNIVMHIGTNNVYDDADGISSALSALQRMFLLMHKQFPDAQIYWFGITQRADDNTKIGYVSTINERMKKWCDGQDFITYIDTPSLISNDMLKDRIHPKVENYSVFVEELSKTDIVIEDADPTVFRKIDDVIFNTSQKIASGTGLSPVHYVGKNLVNNYILSGKLEISEKTTNSHVQFGILNNGSDRILFWDNASKGQFKLCIPYNTNVPEEDIYTLVDNEKLTINWKIVYHENDLYFFINDELKLVYAGIDNSKGTPLMLGSEGTECRFYDMNAVTLTDDAESYNNVIDSMSDIISIYGNTSEYTKIRH